MLGVESFNLTSLLNIKIFHALSLTLNAANHKIRLKFLDQMKEPHREIDISKITMKKLYMIVLILMMKKIRI